MAEGINMICPSCGAFQTRAEVCNKCGIVIAKALNAGNNVAERKTVEADVSKPPLAKFAVIALITIPVIGYFLLSGADSEDTSSAGPSNTSQQKQTAKKSQIERIAVFKPAIANQLQRTNVLSKLHMLRTTLNMYSIEGDEPPSNEEGLQTLVEKGILGQSDITDEWGNVFTYRLEWTKGSIVGKEYKIYVHSNGPDGISGNSDDIAI